MQHVVEAAIKAAAGQGMQGAVILFGQNGVHVPAPSGAAASDQEVTALRVQLEAASSALHQERVHHGAAADELNRLRQQLGAGPSPESQAMQARIAELEQALAQRAAAPADDAAARIAELESKLAEATARAEAAPAGAAAQPGEVQSFDSFGIEHLGLDPACEKLVRKHYETIGALRKDFETLTTEEATKEWSSRTKLKKDYLVSIGVALLGKAPSAAPRGGAAAGARPTTGGGAPDVPEGHSDRTWMERLQAARAREARMRELSATIKSLREKAKAQHPEAWTQDEGEVAPSLKLGKLPPEVRDEIQMQEQTHGVLRGQMIAVCWAANIKPPQEDGDITTIDQALIAAGLGHLVEKAAVAA